MEFSVDSGPKFAGPFFSNAGGIAGNHDFPNFDILPHSGDIRDQSQKGYKIARNFACFWPPIFVSGPRIFGLNLSNRTSFRSCGKVSRRSVEGRRREPGERKKHHEHFIRPPVTTYGRPNKINLTSPDTR